MHTVVSTDGTPIAMWRSGSGPPLLLVHGTTADHTRWSRVTPLLDRHFTVYAMDRRGRGGSGDAPDYRLEREAEDVAAVLSRIGSAAVLGHSYGAICALEAALRGAQITRLMLYEPPIPVGHVIVTPELRARIARTIAEGDREGGVLLFFREVVGVPEEQLDIMRGHPAWPARVAAAHTLAREVGIEDGYSLDFERVRALAVPTLLLQGSESPPFLVEPIRRLHEVLPDSRIVVMQGQHVAMDSAPERFTESIVGFAAGLPHLGDAG